MRDSSARLTTLAIGGPCGGQSLTGDYGHLRAFVPEPLPANFTPYVPQIAEVRIQAAYYHEEKLAWQKDDGSTEIFRFWVHDGIKGGEAILRELIAGYRPVHLDCARTA